MMSPIHCMIICPPCNYFVSGNEQPKGGGSKVTEEKRKREG